MHEEHQIEQFPANANPPENADNAEAEPLSPFHNYLATIIIICVQVLGLPLGYLLTWLANTIMPSGYSGSVLRIGLGTAATTIGILFMMRRKAINLRYLFGTWIDFTTHWKHLLMIIPLWIIAIGYTGLTFGILAQFAPQFVQDIMRNFSVTDHPYGWVGDVYITMAICLIAPVGEEIMFRGTILYRFASYKHPYQAVVSLSILFACFHPQNFFGSLAFAYVAATSYIYSRSLWIPICIHAMNNSLASLGTLAERLNPFQSPMFTNEKPTVEEIQSITLQDIGILLVLLIAGGLVVWRYIKAHPITADTKLPYFAALEKAQSPSQSSIATA
ncbi:MAG: CPBP family intramembrane metalloprotease [Candidatus Kapabacteria bacterium]|nr:CPBP family intramembrane metalloprotease [Candidatus Kapabacteria bacterium]